MRVFWILVKCPAVATARNAFSFFPAHSSLPWPLQPQPAIFHQIRKLPGIVRVAGTRRPPGAARSLGRRPPIPGRLAGLLPAWALYLLRLLRPLSLLLSAPLLSPLSEPAGPEDTSGLLSTGSLAAWFLTQV